jgi:hypothetical protein
MQCDEKLVKANSLLYKMPALQGLDFIPDGKGVEVWRMTRERKHIIMASC